MAATGRFCDGSMSENVRGPKLYTCTKFHAFMKKGTIHTETTAFPCPCPVVGALAFGVLLFIMVDLFLDRVLVKNNWDQDELNTEREIIGTLENRILMLFFACASCEKCREFVPILNDFFKRLKDPFYIENPALLALVYISLDQTEEQQENFLKELHKKTLFVAFKDSYRKELQAKFDVIHPPTVVVLRPDGSVLSANAVDDIRRLGADCFRNWQESAQLVERSFMLNEEYDDLNLRSATDPIRRLKYKTEDDKRRKKWWNFWGKGKYETEEQEEERAAGHKGESPFNMVDLFHGHVLVKNNRNQDELDRTGDCPALHVKTHVPLLQDFHKHLTDEFYVDRSAQLLGQVRSTAAKLSLRAAKYRDLQLSLDRFAAECKAAGMRISTSKSESMVLNWTRMECTLRGGRIGVVSAVMRTLQGSVVVKRELSRKAKLSIYRSIFIPSPMLWIVTERIRSRVQADEMSFLCRVAGLSLRDRVRSSVIREELETMFDVEEVPTVVVLLPDCSVLSLNAVQEICSLGPRCYRN
ncbi:Nucleoredoxin-like protein 1 [Merluccius polli]|uniref:Nucleoredoxin-like protein 1 n=1 Tax=Merluccius polli TaxID=89951 RepID=A0AA47NSE2_MERPO|nr:Nucleoredoxin-like protein 1 [Merluccius polli]